MAKADKRFKKAKKIQKKNPHSAPAAGNLIKARKNRRQSIMKKLKK